MKVHFIAVGGSVMHNLAIALHAQGHTVSGSDDEIYDPAKTRLAKLGLMPDKEGWDESRIHADLDAVVVGMHAKKDNPELLKAHELGIKVYSFPAFIFEHSRSKQRVVICGSHGKTTITSMILYVLKGLGRDFDYLVGGQVEGFETMVRLSDKAPVIILEGDEYLTSPEDPRPKFLVYQPHLAVISGIAWDHINVFPTEENYNRQFELLVQSMPKAGMLVYNEEDKKVKKIVKEHGDKESLYLNPYKTPDSKIRDGKHNVKLAGERTSVSVMGRHNMANLAAAWEVCRLLAVEPEDFLRLIASFTGAAKRLEKVYDEAGNTIFKDFAHSPSKVKATTEAVAEMYKKKNVVACLELHTFSSLNKDFLGQYKATLKAVSNKIIFINEHTLKMKNYPPISREELVAAFGDKNIRYATNIEELKKHLQEVRAAKDNVFLMMSSGNFAGEDLEGLTLA